MTLSQLGIAEDHHAQLSARRKALSAGDFSAALGDWCRAVVAELIGPRVLEPEAISLLLASLCDSRTLAELVFTEPARAARLLARPLVPTPPEHLVAMPEHPLEPSILTAWFRG